MQLELSRRGDYVLRSAFCLAGEYGTGVPTKRGQISAATGVPYTFVSQILGDLVHARLAVSSFGIRGGYRLARSPAEVSLLEVIEAAEGRFTPVACALAGQPCLWKTICPLPQIWGAVGAEVRQTLAATSLATLGEPYRAIAATTRPAPTAAPPPTTRRRLRAPLSPSQAGRLDMPRGGEGGAA